MKTGSGSMLNPPCRFIGKSCCQLKGISWGMCPEVLHSVFWQMVRRFLDWTETYFSRNRILCKAFNRRKNRDNLHNAKDPNHGRITCSSLSGSSRSARNLTCQCQKVCSDLTFHRKYQRYGLNINSVPRVSWR